MGASLDTPTKCPLCDELTPDPVTLKCNHRFCQRCIGDLWSTTPTGPFCCPEWRCKTVYQTPPFDSRLIWPPSKGGRVYSTASAGTSGKDDQVQLNSTLTRPSLTSRLLRKRKANTSVPEQPDTKRSTKEPTCVRTGNSETPTTSTCEGIYQEATCDRATDGGERLPGVQVAANDVNPKSAQSGCDDDGVNSDIYDSSAQQGSVAPQDESVRQNQFVPEEAVTSDGSDSSNEVDICDAPLLTTSQKDTCVLSKQHVSCDPCPGTSTTGKASSPVHHISTQPLIYSATASGSQSRIGVFSRRESRTISPVPCHYCPKSVFQYAVKTCLVCGASMCAEHLRPHMESPVFQTHTLVPPMEDISLWRCQEHHEINRIYCRQCALCVCTVCTVIGSHRDHVCISIREAERELRGNLKEEIRQLQLAEQQVTSRVAELTKKKETFRVVLSEARAGVQQQYTAIREALEQEEQSALQCVAKEENRVLGGLEGKLVRLQSSLQSIQQGLHTLEALADTKGEKRIQEQAFILEYSKIAQLNRDLGSCVDGLEAPEEVDEAQLKCLQKWTEKRLDAVVIATPNKDGDLYRLLYGTIPILDADTAHPKLQLSENNMRVAYNEVQQLYTDQEARFSSFPQVLASRALEGGRWYWEVTVCMDDGRWKVGLCYGQMERKGQKDSSRLGFNAHSWCLACDRRKLEALHNKVAVPVAADRLQRVGVFLDFEEGILSFFNVTAGGSIALLHSFNHRFTDPVYPALSVSKTQLAFCPLFQL
ncbi:tripartite motif-containing protein 14 [Aulostomus maculatus]